jgi:hypothetical protein
MGKMMPDVGEVLAYEEGGLDAESTARMMQNMINSGMAWRMQGSYGRACMDMIESGRCLLGLEGHRDYWGNYVPSRSEVKPGTKGSRAYVVERAGEAWAVEMEKVDA